MKILFLSNLYPPNVVGGYERLCHEMATALAVRGHRIGVLTSDYGTGREDYAGQEIRREWRLPTAPDNIYAPFAGSTEERTAISRANIEKLETTVRDLDPDVIFVWNLYFLDAALLEAIRRQGRPVVYLLTDNWLVAFLQPAYLQDYFAREVFAPPRTLPGIAKNAVKRLLARRSAHRHHLAGQAIFASRFMEDLYRAAGVSFSDSRIVHHGIHGVPAAAAPSRTAPVEAGRLKLLFAGRCVEIKGVHTAIEALPAIHAALPGIEVTLTIVGDRQDAPYQAYLESLVAHHGLAEAIRFDEPVAEDALSDLFAAHDIYLFPSLYEPFSLTLIHALRAGIPTVASNAGGNIEIVFAGRTGLLFQRGDAASLAKAVVQLARDHALRTRLADEGRRIASGFTFARMVTEIERCLGEAR
jgi:glycosyltransferase involved in cell wall biosynthesis